MSKLYLILLLLSFYITNIYAIECNITSPCFNGGICEPLTSLCNCSSTTYTGDYCSINGCTSNPCLNGATCTSSSVDTPMTFVCACTTQYKGTTCTISASFDWSSWNDIQYIKDYTISLSLLWQCIYGAGILVILILLTIIIYKLCKKKKNGETTEPTVLSLGDNNIEVIVVNNNDNDDAAADDDNIEEKVAAFNKPVDKDVREEIAQKYTIPGVINDDSDDDSDTDEEARKKRRKARRKKRRAARKKKADKK